MAASNLVTVCPFSCAALIKASVMAKLLPFLRGLPVITTIFLLIQRFLLYSSFLLLQPTRLFPASCINLFMAVISEWYRNSDYMPLQRISIRHPSSAEAASSVNSSFAYALFPSATLLTNFIAAASAA
jgi:hypothetical protein